MGWEALSHKTDLRTIPQRVALQDIIQPLCALTWWWFSMWCVPNHQGMSSVLHQDSFTFLINVASFSIFIQISFYSPETCMFRVSYWLQIDSWCGNESGCLSVSHTYNQKTCISCIFKCFQIFLCTFSTVRTPKHIVFTLLIHIRHLNVL